MQSKLSVPRFTLPPLVRQFGALLPQWPHTLSLICGLNIARAMGVMPEDTLREIDGRSFRVSVLDTGAVANFTVHNGVFKPLLSSRRAPDLHFSANLSAYLQLLSRQEDPDTLFFNRELTVEGDTELGLLVKNMLDAIDWSSLRHSPARLPIPEVLRARLAAR